MNHDDYPELPFDARPRRLFFEQSPPELDKLALERKGYEVVLLITMPRRSKVEHHEYLLARAQGITEKTIEADEEDRFRLRLEMEAHGLFKGGGVNVRLNLTGAEDFKALFSWDPSRHTLKGTTTIAAFNSVLGDGALEAKRIETTKRLQDEELVEDRKEKVPKRGRVVFKGRGRKK